LASISTEITGLFLPYQIDYLRDPSRFKIWVASRQVGKSLTVAFEATMRAAFGLGGPAHLIISHDDRASKLLLRYIVKWARVLAAVGLASIARETATELWFSNGQYVMSLPGGRTTVSRGFTGDLYIDEGAHHRDLEQSLQAALPTLTRSGGTVSVISSAFSDVDYFWEMYSDPSGRWKHWSRHITTIHTAIEQGIKREDPKTGQRVPLTLDELRELMPDPVQFDCEFGCIPLTDAESQFPKTVLDDATLRYILQRGEGFGGYDIARSQQGDFTALAECKRDHGAVHVDEKGNEARDLLEVTSVVMARRGMEYDEQLDYAGRQFTERGWHRMAVDSTGIGDYPTTVLQKRLGGPARVEAYPFTLESKGRLMTLTRSLMDQGRLSICDDHELWMDFHSIRRVFSDAGNVKYTAEHTERGHADRAIAACLAVHAANQHIAVPTFDFATVPTGGGGMREDWG